MNILYVSNSGIFGGMEWHIYDLARGMSQNGHKVFIWCNSGPIVDFYKKAGASVTERKIRFDIDPAYIRDLKSFIKENSIDVIHGHELKAVANTLIASRGIKSLLKISHTHTPISEWRIGKLKKFLNTRFYSFVINKFSDVEIALTESRKKVKTKEGIKPEKLEVIPNGLDTQKFDITPLQKTEYREEIKKRYNIPKNAFVFGIVARLTVEKGHKILIDAFDKFLLSDLFHDDDFYLLIVGGGILEEEIKGLAKERGMEGRIIITGKFKENDKVKFYSAIDTFIFPTLVEGFGIVLIEAMYNSLPVIASDLEVLKEVGGNTVSFFKKGNSADLSEKMVGTYNKISAEGNVLGESAKKRVEENYTIKRFVDNYLNLYKELLSN